MTTNENSGSGPGPRHGQDEEGQGGWQPIPQGGEYDAEATAFVQLPPEDAFDAPLAAPGHGYVPPQIVPLTPLADPQASSWGAVQHQPTPDAQADGGGVRWPDPQAEHFGQQQGHPGQQQGEPIQQQGHPVQQNGQQQAHPGQNQSFYDAYVAEPWSYAPNGGTDGTDPGTRDSGAGPDRGAGQPQDPGYPQDSGYPQDLGYPQDSGYPQDPGHPHDPGYQESAAGHPQSAGQAQGHSQNAETPSELTGQWTIPVAQGDLPEESGEYSAALLASPWSGANPPATLPGGAPAPWATTPEPEPPAAEQPEPPAAEQLAAEQPRSEAAAEAAAPTAFVSEPDADPSLVDTPASEPLPEAADMPAQDLPSAQDLVPELESAPDPDVVAEPEPVALTSSSDSPEHPANSYVLRVNGADRPVTDSWIGESLLYVLRERLGLAGAKDGCSQGECGACNVQVDGRLVASCLVPAATAAGSEVRTVEGLAAEGEPSDVQRALARQGAVQCGFCIPGMAMTVHDLLEGNHAPSDLETRQALCGNLCRCSGYRGVLDAVNEVAAERRASAAAAALASDEARIPHQAPPGGGSAQHPHSQHSHDGGMA